MINPYFKHNYHYIAPDQGGHGKAGVYISADQKWFHAKGMLFPDIIFALIPSALVRWLVTLIR